jgi:hypothetical protein
MQKLFLAAAVIGAALGAMANVAAAQDYVGGYACVPPPPRPTFLYPDADWGPFFRHHYYRYGPILVCTAAPSIATAPVVVTAKY